jgi:hypothetical protein
MNGRSFRGSVLLRALSGISGKFPPGKLGFLPHEYVTIPFLSHEMMTVRLLLHILDL